MILSYEQVNAYHTLVKFLRRLKVIGVVETEVNSITEFGRPRKYTLKVTQYSPGVYKTPLEEREEALMELVREAEMLGLFD